MANRQLDEEAIFHTARKIENSEARAEYLDQICAGDQALRERVEALLAVHEQEQHFLNSAPDDPVPTVDQSPLTERPGSTIGRYRLMEQVGEGGMGVVFVAEQERPVRRKVAIKIIKPGMDTREVVARFEAERQALALMDHPNIAKVLDAGSTESGRPYFVMELVRGVPITEFCDQAKLTIRERLELFIDVCHAIQHAHQKGIIHRDVKPSNVLITLHDDRPVPKVIDFGVAKATNQRLTERTIYTRFAQIIGTPMYMSPEQAELSGLDVDTRTDIYSLGVLLYELLTGTTPFDGERLRTAAYDEMRRIIREEEPPKPSTQIGSLGATAVTVSSLRKTEPRKLHQIVHGELDWIVMKSMEKNRMRRYEGAASLAADVQRFLTGEAVEAHPPSAAYRVRKFVQRYRVPVTAALAVALALVFGATVATTSLFHIAGLNSRLRRQNQETQVARLRAVATAKHANDAARAEMASRQAAERARKTAEDEAVKRRRLLYISDMGMARQAWETGNLDRLESLLRRHVPRTDEEDLRGFEWFYLWRLWKQESSSLHIDLPDPLMFSNWLSMSSDGSRVAVGHPRGRAAVTLVDIKQHKLLGSFGVGPLRWAGVGMAMSNDGKIVVYRGRQDIKSVSGISERGSVIVRNVNTGEERSIEVNSDLAAVALSSNLRTLAIGVRSSIWLWDLPRWERTTTLEGHTGQINALAFSPDGNSLASASDDRTVRVWSLANKQTLWIGKGNSGGVLCVAYSPRGETVATGSVDRTVAIWDAVAGERLQTLAGPRGEVRAVAFSGDDDLLAAACRDGTIRLWSLPDYIEREIISGSAAQYGLCFLPDGSLLFGAKRGRLVVRKCQIPGYGVLSTPLPHGTVESVAFSSDGKPGGRYGRTRLVAPSLICQSPLARQRCITIVAPHRASASAPFSPTTGRPRPPRKPASFGALPARVSAAANFQPFWPGWPGWMSGAEWARRRAKCGFGSVEQLA